MLLINKWIFESFLYRFDESSKVLIFYFSFFDFDNFLTAFAENLKRPPIFMINMKSWYKLLLSCRDLRSRNFWQWSNGPSKNLYANAFFISLDEKIIAVCHLMIHIKCFAVIFLMKIEALWNGLFKIMGCETWCLIFLGFLLLVVFITRSHFLI